jgi:hypothetical protein
MPCSPAKARKLLRAKTAQIVGYKPSREIVRCWSEKEPFYGKR